MLRRDQLLHLLPFSVLSRSAPFLSEIDVVIKFSVLSSIFFMHIYVNLSMKRMLSSSDISVKM